jgi:hypothetical protein
MKYKPINEQMTHKFCISYKYVSQTCFQCMILVCKCTNYEWKNFAQFILLNCEMLSLWCMSVEIFLHFWRLKRCIKMIPLHGEW